MDDKMRTEIVAVVSRVIKVPVDQIDPNANLFYDLGVDSLLGVEIFAALDKKYGINVPEEKLRTIKTVNAVVSLVESYQKKT